MQKILGTMLCLAFTSAALAQQPRSLFNELPTEQVESSAELETFVSAKIMMLRPPDWTPDLSEVTVGEFANCLQSNGTETTPYIENGQAGLRLYTPRSNERMEIYFRMESEGRARVTGLKQPNGARPKPWPVYNSMVVWVLTCQKLLTGQIPEQEECIGGLIVCQRLGGKRR
jgi:hypothetical protein